MALLPPPCRPHAVASRPVRATAWGAAWGPLRGMIRHAASLALNGTANRIARPGQPCQWPWAVRSHPTVIHGHPRPSMFIARQPVASLRPLRRQPTGRRPGLRVARPAAHRLCQPLPVRTTVRLVGFKAPHGLSAARRLLLRAWGCSAFAGGWWQGGAARAGLPCGRFCCVPSRPPRGMNGGPPAVLAGWFCAALPDCAAPAARPKPAAAVGPAKQAPDSGAAAMPVGRPPAAVMVLAPCNARRWRAVLALHRLPCGLSCGGVGVRVFGRV